MTPKKNQGQRTFEIAFYAGAAVFGCILLGFSLWPEEEPEHGPGFSWDSPTATTTGLYTPPVDPKIAESERQFLGSARMVMYGKDTYNSDVSDGHLQSLGAVVCRSLDAGQGYWDVKAVISKEIVEDRAVIAIIRAAGRYLCPAHNGVVPVAG
jgi:hypothetical protein